MLCWFNRLSKNFLFLNLEYNCIHIILFRIAIALSKLSWNKGIVTNSSLYSFEDTKGYLKQDA